MLLALLTAGSLVASPQSPDTAAGLRELMKKHEVSASYADLRKHLARYAKSDKSGGRLSAITAMLEDPVSTTDFADELTLHLRDAGREVSIEKILLRSARLLDLTWQPTSAAETSTGHKIEDTLARFERARVACEAAFAKIPAAEHQRLQKATHELATDFARHIYVHQKPQNKLVWQRVQTVDLSRLFEAAHLLAPMVHLEFARGLEREIMGMNPRPSVKERPPGVEGRLLFAKKTEAGWFVIGGSGKNLYDGPLAFVLDVGGDDTYRAGATRSGVSQRTNVVIDMKGDDRYEADQDFAQGCGRFGVSLLIDHRGNDRYEAKRVAQGASLVGIGILVDHRGKDHYAADAFGQGVGCFGLGLLLDREGDDVMQSHLVSQGFAWPLSTGLLIDLAGNDERTATGKYPSVYGTKGKFNAMSQGASVGFRTLASGGFGVLIDGGGDDVSDVGEFGHGCGYYFGCGIVRDFAGDDRVRAARYGIATGAHFGVSAVLDDAGNDEWKNPGGAAAIAGNWDLTVSCFVDRKGDDRYEAPGLGIGCATITSFASFVDLGGIDHYAPRGTNSLGRAGHAQDAARKTKSVAVFVDWGGEKDTYPDQDVDPKPGNDRQTGLTVRGGGKNPRTIGHAVFSDRAP